MRTGSTSQWEAPCLATAGDYWPLGTQQRLVMEFALETASRRGEVVRLGPQHVKNGHIRIERTHGSADVEIPMSPQLRAACDAMPKGHLTYIVTAYGKPRSKYGRFIERFRFQHGDKRVALLRRDHIEQMLAAIEKPTAKRGWLKAIRPLLQSAVPSMRKDDPTAGIGGVKLPKSNGHHTWSDDEIEQYRASTLAGIGREVVPTRRFVISDHKAH